MNRPRNEQMKPIIMALGTGAGAAVAAMMVPVSLIEGITGATGLSELIPATGAPLGGTARAIIAFFAGALTLMMAMGYLMRRNPDMKSTSLSTPRAAEMVEPGNSLLSKLQKRMSGFKASDITIPAMPWAKKAKSSAAHTAAPSPLSEAQSAPKSASWFKKHDDDILDLSELPRLRANDAHPDAPARRPISALSDLAEANLTNCNEPLNAEAPRTATLPMETLLTQPFQTAPVGIAREPILNNIDAASLHMPVAQETVATPAAVSPISVSQDNIMSSADVAELSRTPLASLVTQLEAAINQRMHLLNAIESLSAQVVTAKAAIPAEPEMHQTQVYASSAISHAAPILETVVPAAVPITPRPPLEAVPASPQIKQDQDMDAALNAALETLQRMNVQGR